MVPIFLIAGRSVFRYYVFVSRCAHRIRMLLPFTITICPVSNKDNGSIIQFCLVDKNVLPLGADTKCIAHYFYFADGRSQIIAHMSKIRTCMCFIFW